MLVQTATLELSYSMEGWGRSKALVDHGGRNLGKALLTGGKRIRVGALFASEIKYKSLAVDSRG